jgi:hypothetical protein
MSYLIIQSMYLGSVDRTVELIITLMLEAEQTLKLW